MTVPTTELPIYLDSTRWSRSRVIMGLDYPARTEAFDDDFDSGLDPKNWRFSQQGAGPPLATTGALFIRSFGIPPWETVQTRVHIIPRDPTVSFRIQFVARFAQEDPKYDTGIWIGATDGPFGPGSDIKIIQHGLASDDDFPGRIVHYPPASFPAIGTLSDFVIAPDLIGRQYKIEWHVGDANPLKFYIDGDLLYETTGPRPKYVNFGLPWTRTTKVKALGTVASPAILMEITNFRVEEIGALPGYEVRTYPNWTTPNAGGTTQDDSDPGELYVEDGVNWAIVPENLYSKWQVSKALTQQAATFNITFHPSLIDQDILAWPHYEGRDILIDTQSISITHGAASWKRQIAGKVEKQRWTLSGDGMPSLVLSGSCRVMKKFDDNVVMNAKQSTGEHASVQQNFTFQQMYEFLCGLVDSIAGDSLGPIDFDITAPVMIIEALSDGGQTLQNIVADWNDRLVQEMVVKYAPTGASRYGTVQVHLFDTVPTGTPFPFARNNVSSATIDDEMRRAPGRFAYNPNLTRTELLSALTIPGQGHAGFTAYPVFPYPEYRRTVSDSIAYANLLGIDTTVAFPDRSASSQFGGIAKLRWLMEVAQQRKLTVHGEHQDWPEPGDNVNYDGSAVVGSDEVWFINSIDMSGNQYGTEVDIEAFSTDIEGNVTRGGYS